MKNNMDINSKRMFVTQPTRLLSCILCSFSGLSLAAETMIETTMSDGAEQETVAVLPVIQLRQSSADVHAQQQMQALKQKLQQVNGGTNVIDAQQLAQTKLSTTEDVLRFQPGIYAKSAGNEGIRLSIRGSGINRGSGGHGSGTYVSLDGIPFTAPGGTPYELLDPAWLAGAEVYRGANGVRVGSLNLGGAVNFLTPTGLTASTLELHHELGSRGYQRSHLSSGQQLGNLDYYLSFSYADNDGFQQHSSSSAKGIAANLGYQINPDLHTRFYLRYRETDHQTPGRISKAQLVQDPTSANPSNVLLNSSRPQPGSVWIANKTTLDLHEQGQLDFGLAYHHFPMDLQEGYYSTDVNYDDVTAFFNYQKPSYLWGHASVSRVGFRSTTDLPSSPQVIERLRVDKDGIQAGTQTRHFSYTGSDNILTFGNELELVPEFWLISGLGLSYMQRESDVSWPVQSQKQRLEDWNWAPSLGLRYQVNPQVQLFSNISRSVEAPHAWSMIYSSDRYFDANNSAGQSAAIGRQREPIAIDTQTANTFEIGGRGSAVWGDWDISYYYSKVKNELLAVELQAEPKQIIAESNASDTIHQGFEIGLNSALWQNDAFGTVSLKQSYNLSDFHYRHDEKFDQNELAGIPKHYYQAELRYQHPVGFYAALNTEYAAKIAIDYANSHYTDHYQLWGASFGYANAQQNYSAWLDFRNIGDEKYASTVTPGFNDQGKDVARLTPGDGFGVYAGFTYKLL